MILSVWWECTKTSFIFPLLMLHEALMHISCSSSESHEISILGFLFSVVSQYNNGRNTLQNILGEKWLWYTLHCKLKIGRGFEIQECPKAAGMVRDTGGRRDSVLVLKSGQEDIFFFLYVSMIGVTNWLLSNNLESDMNQQSGMWTSNRTQSFFCRFYEHNLSSEITLPEWGSHMESQSLVSWVQLSLRKHSESRRYLNPLTTCFNLMRGSRTIWMKTFCRYLVALFLLGSSSIIFSRNQRIQRHIFIDLHLIFLQYFWNCILSVLWILCFCHQ